MLNQKMIEALEAKGFKRWTRGDMDRLYINPEVALNFEYDTNKSGNVSGAYLNGEKISNNWGREIVNSKTYIDVNTGKLVSNYDMMRDAAQEIMDSVTAEIEQAEVAVTNEIVEGKELTEDQIEYLHDEGFFIDRENGRLIMSTVAAGLNPIWPTTIFRGVEYTEAQAKELSKSVTWIDMNTGMIYSDNEIMRECAVEMVNRVNDRIMAEDDYAEWAEAHSEELKAAYSEGNYFPECKIVRFCLDNEIDVPKDMTATIERLNREYVYRETQPAFSSNGWLETAYRIMCDWRDGKLV